MQVVAGVNHHLIMSTVDSDGQGHRVDAIIHEDTSGDVPKTALQAMLSTVLLCAGNHKLLSTRTESLQSVEQKSPQPNAQSTPTQDTVPASDNSGHLWLWITVACSLTAVVCFVAGVLAAMLIMRRNSPAAVTVKAPSEYHALP